MVNRIALTYYVHPFKRNNRVVGDWQKKSAFLEKSGWYLIEI